MLIRFASLVCMAVTITLAATAQSDEPVLISASIPKYPPLARQARLVGVARVTFTLEGNNTEPTNIQAASGLQPLSGAAIANIKTWRFDNPYAVARKYEVTFEFLLGAGQSVCFESFHHVRIAAPEPIEPEPNF
jgi:hypothetical protein